MWLLTDGFRLACCQAFEMYVVFRVRDVNSFFLHISVFHLMAVLLTFHTNTYFGLKCTNPLGFTYIVDNVQYT